MTPTNGNKLRTQRSLFDLDSMSDVSLFKEIEFQPVTTAEEALNRVGHDKAKFLAVINEGLQSHALEAARNDNSIPWMQENDEGEASAFAGTPADSKAVNGLVLNLAKSVFGYSKDATPDQKRAAKQSALDMVKATPAIVEGLKKNAAL